MAGMTGLTTVAVSIAVAAVTGISMGSAAADGIAVLTKAEPGLSQSGKAIWHCTYIVGNRERTVILETPCPAAMRM